VDTQFAFGGTGGGIREPHQLRNAAWSAAFDATLLTIGVAAGWFAAAEVFVAAWAQTLLFGVATFVVLKHAGSVAADGAQVDAGRSVQIGHRDLTGKEAATATALMFALHFGLFVAALGVAVWTYASAAGWTAGPLWAWLLLLLRAVAANAPMALADHRFVASGGYDYLAAKSESLLLRGYLRMVPLHVGILVVVAPQASGPGWRVDASMIIVVVAMTFVGSLWRYPGQRSLTAPRPSLDGNPQTLPDLMSAWRRQRDATHRPAARPTVRPSQPPTRPPPPPAPPAPPSATNGTEGG
jgi:hypothetical protein